MSCRCPQYLPFNSSGRWVVARSVGLLFNRTFLFFASELCLFGVLWPTSPAVPVGPSWFFGVQTPCEPFRSRSPKTHHTDSPAAPIHSSSTWEQLLADSNPLQPHVGIAPSLDLSQLGHHSPKFSSTAISACYGIQLGMEFTKVLSSSYLSGGNC